MRPPTVVRAALNKQLVMPRWCTGDFVGINAQHRSGGLFAKIFHEGGGEFVRRNIRRNVLWELFGVENVPNPV